jgi:hypothetical protein
MSHSSAWQAHKAGACSSCWYCVHPDTGSPTIRVIPAQVYAQYHAAKREMQRKVMIQARRAGK